jgi:hypothetical protein
MVSDEENSGCRSLIPAFLRQFCGQRAEVCKLIDSKGELSLQAGVRCSPGK